MVKFAFIAFVLLSLFGCEFERESSDRPENIETGKFRNEYRGRENEPGREDKNHSKIIRTDDLETIKSACAGADPRTLVIFDMDNVLTESMERAFQSDLYPKIKKIVDQYKEQVKKMSPSDQEKLKGAQWEIPVCLVDNGMPLLIKSLQDREIKVLMLTANPHGKIANVDSIEALCDSRLRALGINFEKSWPSVDIKRDFDNELTIFYKGEIFTLESKEIALKRFLECSPKHEFGKIIFLDDKRKNLEKVKNLAKKLKKVFIGVEYFRVFTKKRPKIDLSLVKEHFERLKKVVSSKTKSV